MMLQPGLFIVRTDGYTHNRKSYFITDLVRIIHVTIIENEMMFSMGFLTAQQSGLSQSGDMIFDLRGNGSFVGLPTYGERECGLLYPAWILSLLRTLTGNPWNVLGAGFSDYYNYLLTRKTDTT